MKRLGIIQPGKIGDIIVCLPIARYFFNKGYKVFWPIDQVIIKNFIGYCSYAEFIPIDFNCNTAKSVCLNDYSCNHLLDLSFTLPGSWNNLNTKYYRENETNIKFDELKYQIADIPFDEKWNLQITRNTSREKELFLKLNLKEEEDYIVVQWRGSDYYKRIKIQDLNNIKEIEIQPITTSVFDWIYVLEKAKGFVLIDSCIANLVEQLKMPQPKIFLARQPARPTHKLHWKVVEYYE